MKKELGHEAIYDARQLGTPRMLVLGLQHMFAMFGATVLVPILVQGYGLPLSIQTTLLFAGLGTLLFHVCTKMKVPAFLGSSFAYLGGFETVAKLDAGKYAGMSGDEKLAYALGGIVIAGLLYLVLALLFKMLGAKKVMRYFPPIVTGPMIIMIGLNLSMQASWTASAGDIPDCSRMMAKSIIMMPFFFTMPISMNSPIIAYMESSISNIQRLPRPPTTAIGSDERTVIGCM